jgi:hypothetical protein
MSWNQRDAREMNSMRKTDGYFEDDLFVLQENYFYKDPEDMPQFGELMEKFAGRMHDPEGWSLVVNAHTGYVQVTGTIGRHKLFSPTSESRNSLSNHHP